MNETTKIEDELADTIIRMRDWAISNDDCYNRAKKMSDALEKTLTRAIITLSNQSAALCKLGESLSGFCEALSVLIAMNLTTASTSQADRTKVIELETRLSEFVKGFN